MPPGHAFYPTSALGAEASGPLQRAGNPDRSWKLLNTPKPPKPSGVGGGTVPKQLFFRIMAKVCKMEQMSPCTAPGLLSFVPRGIRLPICAKQAAEWGPSFGNAVGESLTFSTSAAVPAK